MRWFEISPYKSCLLGDDMGMGKTVQILALCLANPMEALMLVMAPSSILDNRLCTSRHRFEFLVIITLSITVAALSFP
jgi:SNF2 family DNA or RNA helicase